ncbi:hypothetical protein BKA69DRAFT_607873 [Paraphysoderma sedebokerense]|nr:hypothetical protein BKA69DRAFT_607873 [Paraphysoderma sedebokerense]
MSEFDLYTSSVVFLFTTSTILLVSRSSLTGLTADGKSGVAITACLASTMMATLFNLLTDHGGFDLTGQIVCLWISQLFYWPSRVSRNYYLYFRSNNVTQSRHHKLFYGSFLLTVITDFIWTMQVLISTTIASTDAFNWVSYDWSTLPHQLSAILFLGIVEASFLYTIWTNRLMIQRYRYVTMERLAIISAIRMCLILIAHLVNLITDISGADATGTVYTVDNIITALSTALVYIDLNIKFYADEKIGSSHGSAGKPINGTSGSGATPVPEKNSTVVATVRTLNA